MPIKNGLLTTEFWVTVAAAIWTMIQPEIDGLVKAALPAIGAMAYTLVRGWVKARV